jgi:hypothetical protein
MSSTRTVSPYFSPNSIMAPVFLALFDAHHTRLRRCVGQNFGIDMASIWRICASVTGALCVKSKRVFSASTKLPFCCTWSAQHFAQGFVHQVGGAVVAHGGGAQAQVHMGLHRIAHLEAAGLDHFTVVAEHIGLDLLSVSATRQTGPRVVQT